MYVYIYMWRILVQNTLSCNLDRQTCTHDVPAVREVEEVRRDIRILKRGGGRTPGIAASMALTSPRTPAVISDWARGVESARADDLDSVSVSGGAPGSVMGGSILSADGLEQFTRDAIYMLHK
jgi:hypothetical protein